MEVICFGAFLEHLINSDRVVGCSRLSIATSDRRRAEEQNSADLRKPKKAAQAAAHIIALSKSSRGCRCCFRSRRISGVTGSLGRLDFGFIR